MSDTKSPAPVAPQERRRSRAGRRATWGRRIAQLLCALFALIGLLPVVAGILLRTDAARSRLAVETARVLDEQLGVKATYEVRVQLLPLRLSLENVVVPANDQGTPVLTARSVRVAPRLFALLSGRLDAGDIEIEAPRARVVLEDGKLKNLDYRLPKPSGKSKPLERAPFASIAISDAAVDLQIDRATHVTTQGVDIDVYAEDRLAFEVAVRAGETHVERERERILRHDPRAGDREEPERTHADPAHDEDVVCQLDLRARYESGGVLVRRLALLGAADDSERKGTAASCRVDELTKNPYRVALRLSGVRVTPRPDELPLLDGHLFLRAPIEPVNRYTGTKLGGWVGLSGSVHFDGSSKLPSFSGRLKGGKIGMGGYSFAKYLDAQVELAKDVVELPKIKVGYANGDLEISEVRIEPLAKEPRISMAKLDGKGMDFPGLMRDLDVTENTVCQWDLDRTLITDLKGTLVPLKLDAQMYTEASRFEIFDRAYHDPARKHMIGVRAPQVVRARIGVRPKAFEFYDVRGQFGHSRLLASVVSLGFNNQFKLGVSEGTKIELADIGPLVDIPIAGLAELDAQMVGTFGDPVLEGHMKVKGFEFGGFPLGDIERANTRFRPLVLELSNVHGKKGTSHFDVSSAKLDFDSDATVLVDAEVASNDLDIRDFFAMWHFDEDPRFEPIKGRGAVQASVHFDFGGKADKCGGGFLQVRGEGNFGKLELFEERYDKASASFDFRWLDRDASYLGFELDMPSFSLSKGGGVFLGSLALQRGGILRGHGVGTRVPLPAFQSMGSLADFVSGYASGTAEVYGSVDQLSFDASVVLGGMHVGTTKLPGSILDVALRPLEKKKPVVVGRTRCGAPITAPFNRARWEKDEPDGVFHVDGELFGGQVKLSDLQITRQRSKRVKGGVTLEDLDVGAFAEVSPALAVSAPPKGRLSAHIDIADLPLDRPREANATIQLKALDMSRSGAQLELVDAKPIVIRGQGVSAEHVAIGLRSPGTAQAVFDLSGGVTQLGRDPNVDFRMELRPLDLSSLAKALPRVDRAKGLVRGNLAVRGPLRQLTYSGGFQLTGGELALVGVGNTLSDVEFEISVDSDQIAVRRGSARVGSGTVKVTGDARLSGTELGRARFVINAEDISLPLTSGVETTADAALIASWDPQARGPGGEPALPRLTGDVTIQSFRYTRPVTMAVDISSLASRGKRTQFESYDPADDRLEFDITVKASRALTLSNNLIDAELVVGRQGLLLSGTNQRFGMRGSLKLKPGGRIRLRQSEFEVQQGSVRFDDLTRIAPRVDVTASTEYRRYSDAAAATGSGGDTGSAGGSSAASATGGRWNITLHAYGDTEQLKIDLTSNPALSQDDIVLLLTIGLTRAELDQAQSASVGESVALEALGTLTGADQAVTKAVPVIDEFNFGSSYSSRTGRTEPTVTIGKRLADRIRANVTSGISDSREVRSNLEWRLNRRVSVEGSYDNVNDLGSSSLGNLGADLRWRLEFQ
ncbi:MAG: translocation/assembly module TamB domain-containing protein [Myxococcales bacterium]|nr:translocation/assembly module TamB domain-containing protein [Myxococcales bacterium]